MRFFTLIIFVLIVNSVYSQVGQSSDQEYISICMVDKTTSGATRFTRLILVGSLTVVDIDNSGIPYTVTGTVQSCEEYDLAESMRDPAQDFYEACQCVYTINQENHRVIEVVGDTIQEFTVEFQEVVRRRCTGEENDVVVHRDTLTKTSSITGYSTNYGIRFDGDDIGKKTSSIDVRVYTTGGNASIVTVDLDPATVQSTYPALTIDTADLRYNGSNIGDMQAAYLTVIQYAVNQVAGPVVNNITAISGSSTGIRFELLHAPQYPYAMLPDPDDNDFQIVTDIPITTVTFGVGRQSIITQTNFYNEECTGIFTAESDIYLKWDRLAPLSLSPDTNLSPFLRPNSVPTAFCDVDPAICNSLAPDEVTLSGCIEECSDVSNLAGQMEVQSESVVFQDSSYASISLFVVSGSVDVTIGGTTIQYPTGYRLRWNAADKQLINNEITVNASSGRAFINYMQ